MRKLNKLNQWQILGMALCFAWVFLAHPTVDASAGMQMGLQDLKSSLLRFATVGAVFFAILPVFSAALSSKRNRAIISGVGLLLRVTGSALGIVALALPDPFYLLLSGNLLTGASVAIALTFWGLLLTQDDVEQGETAFVLTFIVAGIVVFIVGFLPKFLLDSSLFFLPIIEFICYLVCNAQTQSGSYTKRLRKNDGDNSQNSYRRFFVLCFRALLAITLVSFVWEMFSNSSESFAFAKQSVFGLGLIGAAVIILLFTRYSSSTGFNAAARWVLPIMAVGLFFNSIDELYALIVACLLLATAHASFETILRMQIIDFARRHTMNPAHIVGWGFCSIALGAFAGQALCNLLFGGSDEVNRMQIIGILVLMVVIGAFLFSPLVVSPSTISKQDDVSTRSKRMAQRYGLSARETEILGYLLEGRSHPYIRDELFISKSTVDTHVRHIYTKVGVKSKQELIDASKGMDF